MGTAPAAPLRVVPPVEHLEWVELLCRWAAWAEEEVETWAGVTPETGARVPPLMPPGRAPPSG